MLCRFYFQIGLSIFSVFLTSPILSYGEESSGNQAEAAKSDAHAVKSGPSGYMMLYTDVERLNGSIKAKQEALNKLFEDRNKAKDDASQRTIVKSIQDEFQALEELTEEYEKKKLELRFRFPDKGESKSETHGESAKSGHGLGNESIQNPTDSQLSDSVKAMRKQYNPILKKKIQNKKTTGPSEKN